MSSKPVVATMKLTPGKQKQIDSAIVLLQEHYGAVLAVWGQLTAEQREAALAHSPLLAKLMALILPVALDVRTGLSGGLQ